MFNGTVHFDAQIKGIGLRFPLLEFNPNESRVSKVEMDGLNEDQIKSTVHLTNVATPEVGRALATKVFTAALDRITFAYGIVADTARISGEQFNPIQPQPGAQAFTGSLKLCCTATSRVVVGIHATDIKTELEKETPPGECCFGLYRSALQSDSPVEKFILLYRILMMLFNDRQANVDAFIVSEDAAVARTQIPGRRRRCCSASRLRASD